MHNEEFTDQEIDILLKVYSCEKQGKEGQINQSPYNRSIKVHLDLVAFGLWWYYKEATLMALDKFEKNGYIKIESDKGGFFNVWYVTVFINKKGLRFIKDHIKLKRELNL